ncbi:MAG: alanine racemase [Pseudomonadota bacterium]
MRATQVVIDLAALRHNLARARAAAPASRILAAIKANGYGHGMLRVARALDQADGFGVACLAEALQLREAGIRQPIVLLEGFFGADELEAIARHRFIPAIHNAAQLELLEQAVLSEPIAVWLKVDSGMHRLGFPLAQAQQAWQRLAACHNVSAVVGCMTHLANADNLNDDFTARQLADFRQHTAGLPGERSIANSAALLGWPGSHAEWVRPGIMLYGVSPLLGGRGEQHDLRPVMTLRSELIAVNHLKRGEAVGYGGAFVCPEDMVVGVVAAGYGDGYPRHVGNGVPVLVNGRRVPLVGRVSMDMLTVDLRSQSEARPGDAVVLWGAGLPVEEIAEHAGTIPYELLCRVMPRVDAVENGA